MSSNKLNDAAQLAVASARAFYGDFTGVAVQAVKYAPQIITLACAILLVIIMIPLAIVQSIFSGGSGTGALEGAAVEALQYKEDWIKVLAVARTKEVLSGEAVGGMSEAAEAVQSGSIEGYIGKDNMELYRDNLELLENAIGSYAGYGYYYEELPLPSYKYDKIILENGRLAAVTGSTETVIYSSNEVISFKIDGRIKIKYRKFGLSAYFPISGEYDFNFSDDFGGDRVNDGEHTGHEGIDIFAARNTPILAVEDCTISKIGWNGLGGWRILMDSKDGKRTYYYAHMENYSSMLQQYKDGSVHENPGINIKAGEVIGYVGSSGGFYSNCPPGTDTGTPTHIHFQLWVKSMGWFSDKETLINPYSILKLLEHSKGRKQMDEILEKEGL